MNFDNTSNFEIIQMIDKVFRSERLCQANFILLLSEVYKRSLYLEAGHSTMTDYCTKRFGLSEYSSYKRIQLSKISARFPEILEALKEKKLSLTTASLIAPKLKAETYREQMIQCFGKSKDEVKRIIVGWEPKPDVTESVRHYKRPVAKEDQAATSKNNTAHRPDCVQPQSFLELQQPGITTDSSSDTKRPELIPLSQERTCLRFSVSTMIEEKLSRAKEVCGVRGLEEIFDLALEALLEKKDPQRREERRQKREILRFAQNDGNDNAAQDEQGCHAEPQAKHPNTEPVPVRLKDSLLRESGYQCTYMSPEGHRCQERQRLEVDHVRPRAKGGTNDPANLRILCREHNRYQGALHFGWEKMRGPSRRSG
jgi:5-methylcytosine-specific restriction endonuclease McrA